MTITVSSGVTSSGLTISSGDPLVVLSGGAVSSASILSGGSATVSSGAIATNVIVASGGALQGAGKLEGGDNTVEGLVSGVLLTNEAGLTVLSGGLAVDVTVEGSENSSDIYVRAGGTVSGSTIGAYQEENVSSGGVSIDDTIEYRGTLQVFGGTASGATVQSGGDLYYRADFTSNFTLSSNQMAATTTLQGVTLLSGAIVSVFLATVDSGVTLSLGSGAAAFSLALDAGAAVGGPGELGGDTDVAGSVTGVTVGDTGRYPSSDLEIQSGGAATDVTVVASSTVTVDAGGVVTVALTVSLFANRLPKVITALTPGDLEMARTETWHSIGDGQARGTIEPRERGAHTRPRLEGSAPAEVWIDGPFGSYLRRESRQDPGALALLKPPQPPGTKRLQPRPHPLLHQRH